MSRSTSLAFALDEILAAAESLLRPAGESETPVKAVTADFEAFLRRYAVDAKMEDFALFSAEDAANLALGLWDFGLSVAADARAQHIRPCISANGKNLNRSLIEIVGPDTRFLVDSAISACLAAGAEILAATHPTLTVNGVTRSFIQIQTRPLNDAREKALLATVREAIDDVYLSTRDYPSMRAGMLDAASHIASLPVHDGREHDDIDEAIAFLDWLVKDHFIFLGAREYRYARDDNGDFLPHEPEMVEGSGLGVLRSPDRHVLSRGSEPAVLTARIRAFLDEPQPLIVSKANMRSRVHRRVYADYIGVKRYDEMGAVIGETRFVGLFTSDAYTRMARDVPLIRRKVARVRKMLEDDGEGYSARALNNVLETYPRDELFQIEPEELERIAQNVLALMQRPRTRLFIRRDRFDRFVSALLFTPRDSYTPDLRRRAHTAIARAYGGRESAYYPQFGDGPLARVHYIVGLDPGHPEPDEDALDLQIRQMAESWEDGLSRAARLSGETSVDYAAASFNAAYKEAFSAEEALRDLIVITGMGQDNPMAVRVTGQHDRGEWANCKIYHIGHPLDLSDMVPVIEHMGLRVLTETSFPITLRDFASGETKKVYVHDVALKPPAGSPELRETFEKAFSAVWNGETENDGFNQLITLQGLSWREAALVRTLCRYRQQSGMDPSEQVQIAALRSHPEITGQLVRLFHERLEPAGDSATLADRRAAEEHICGVILRRLDNVTSLDEDRVLRRLMHLVQAIQRTNFYQTAPGGAPYPYIAIKIASPELVDLPDPKPFREIFIWSPRVEGVHLRFGPVARGGLRWSDRRDDFRTEVLGLVKAQNVKNAVIVPVGSKGGFFPKAMPEGASREAVREAGVAAYRTFISALLELTDNLIDGAPVHPDSTVIWDGDDPYLVVAADKGTATFSDIANEISCEHGFWLGDAFASGGSAGYDHKKMGITARGAWEAVKRHFREMGKDIQSEPFTCIGVGDMSGDVFGNGMLLSKQTKLVAAFNHLHVFVDPNPDPTTSWDERKRIFDLPRSTWDDYDRSLISAGGGVFDRKAKAINLTPEIQSLTGLEATSVTPDELIAALLRADVELLWFGGIGTYVKSSRETHAAAGDKINDGLRADADKLRAKVVGEGANLGLTQAARIEFARHGGRLNTDAIDNSAGVDSSDHEVNIKILLTEAIRRGDLPLGERNALLASMTDEVAGLVLRHNYDQTGALSVLEATAPQDLDAYGELMRTLEREGKLNRRVEGLPGTGTLESLRERGLGLSRPELSVLMAYAKNDLFDALVASDAPDEPALRHFLDDYFPNALDRFGDARNAHRLKREIVATILSNRLVNLLGPFWPYQMRDGASVDISLAVKASEAARRIYGVDELIKRIEALDNVCPAQAQTDMMIELRGTLRQLAAALTPALRAGDSMTSLIKRYTPSVRAVRDILDEALSEFVRDRIAHRANGFMASGAPADIAMEVARLRTTAQAKETADCAQATGWPLAATANIQHAVSEALAIDPLRAAIRDTQLDGHWERLALQRVADALPGQQAALILSVIRDAQAAGIAGETLTREAARDAVANWLASRRRAAERVTGPTFQFDAGGGWTLAKLVLVGDALREFIETAADAPSPPPARKTGKRASGKLDG